MVAASGHGRVSPGKAAESGSGATTRSPTPAALGDRGGSSGGSTLEQLGPPEPPPYPAPVPFARPCAGQAARGPADCCRSPGCGATASAPPVLPSACAAAPRSRLWSVSVGETEEGFECNVRDRELRKFAAASGLYLPDVEDARVAFDRSRRLEQASRYC